MAFKISLTSSKESITLGNTFTVTYNCVGAYKVTIQSDNMPNPITLGTTEVSGSMKFLPGHSGPFNVTLTAHGVVAQGKGIDNMSNTETNLSTVTVNVN
jgi:hypothetical protein